jgi:anthranilate phosphoribosyltransferase
MHLPCLPALDASLQHSGRVLRVRRNPLKQFIEILQNRVDLGFDEIKGAAVELASPLVSDSEKAAFLVALKDKGETGEELGYFAQAFLDMSIRPPIDFSGKKSIDIVGTGGDRLELINVSTTCMFLLSAAGVVVAKHGNKAITSKSGAADVLEALGVPVTCSIEQMADCINTTGIGFLFAPLYHPAFRVVAPIRLQLAERGIATIFNLLGPLLNPAKPDTQLTGVFSPTILEKYATAMSKVGRKRAWVVHGQIPNGSGMDEISLLGETVVHEVKDGRIDLFHLFPDQLGFRMPTLHELRGSDAHENAQILTDILANRDKSARRDLILINAAAALVVAGIVQRMSQGIDLANELLDSGAALQKLEELQQFFKRNPARNEYR